MNDQSRAGRVGRALTEFVIIVVGVLVALGVDSWNSGRAERALELSYLDALAEELRADSTVYIQVALPALEDKEAALAAIAPVVRGHDPMPGDTIEFLRQVSLGGRGGGGLSYVMGPTFDELINTGGLRYLESALLRTRLVEYYTELDIHNKRVTDRISGYFMAVHEFYPAEMRGQQTDDQVRAFANRLAIETVTSDRFERMMNQELNLLYFMRSTLSSVHASTNDLIRLVDEERARVKEGG